MLQCFFIDLNADEFVKGMYLHVHCRLTPNPNCTDPINLKMPTYIGWRNFQRQMDYSPLREGYTVASIMGNQRNRIVKMTVNSTGLLKGGRATESTNLNWGLAE